MASSQTMKVAECHVLREKSTTAYIPLLATCQFAICVSKFKGNEDTSSR